MFSSVAKTDQYEVASYKNQHWLKVFFHNHTTKVNFIDEKEARHCNSEFKYSILDEINPSMRINKKYEFIMDFPGFSSYFIRWEQNKNPVRELDGKPQADGFKILEDSRPNNPQSFNGLTRSTIRDVITNKINCFLDGIPYDYHWYYAIGMYENSSGNYKTEGIPAYQENVRSIRLWIKIDPKGKWKQCTASINRRSINIYLMMLNILFS